MVNLTTQLEVRVGTVDRMRGEEVWAEEVGGIGDVWVTVEICKRSNYPLSPCINSEIDLNPH